MSPFKPINLIIRQPQAVVSFCRRAMARDTEILGLLTGRVRGSTIYIDGIEYPKLKVSDAFEVEYDAVDAARFEDVIGTIHSHPNVEPHLSTEDMYSSSRTGEIVFAIFSFWKPTNEARRRRTSLDWYCGSPLVKVA